MLYKVALVSLDERFVIKEPVAELQVDGEKGKALLLNADPHYAKQLEEFADSLETEGVVLLAESMTDGKDHGPFDMWITSPTPIEHLDAMVFPDLHDAVFDYKIDELYVRLTPVFGTALPKF